MKWIVESNLEFINRQIELKHLMKEKREQIEKLKFELGALEFLHTTLKNIGWKKD